MRSQITIVVLTAVVSGCAVVPVVLDKATPSQPATTSSIRIVEKGDWILASKLPPSEDTPQIEMKIPERSSVVGGPPAAFRSGKWQYVFMAQNRHHSTGKLEYDGLAVRPDKSGQVINTPFGKLRFFSLKERRHLSGWFKTAGNIEETETARRGLTQ